MNTQKKLIYSTKLRSLFAAVLCLLSPISTWAAVLYSQDFESVPVGTSTSLPPGLTSAGMSSGGAIASYQYELLATGGTAMSKGLRLVFNTTNTSSYNFDFGGSFGSGNGAVTSASQIRISMDIKVGGAVTSMPLTIRAEQIDIAYESDPQVDVNMDGDMTDIATVFRSEFSPSLVNGSDYTRVSFTLDQGQISADLNHVFPLGPPRIPPMPLPPAFNPTKGMSWKINIRSPSFGFDAGNEVRVDNILIETVPEPTGFAMVAVAVCGLALNCTSSRRCGR